MQIWHQLRTSIHNSSIRALFIKCFMKTLHALLMIVLLWFAQSCRTDSENIKIPEKTSVANIDSPEKENPVLNPPSVPFDSTTKTIHIMVALCDNFYQGIVPVPEGIGNGQDPRTNLYWGCGYGVKTFFKRSADWQLLKTQSIDSIIHGTACI
jgi:hypothetical protein